ncbi:MAG: PAS domain S-box protein [Pseudomonadota bacterium]
MTLSSFIGLLNNAALLLAMGVLYDTLVTWPVRVKFNWEQIFSGLILGVIGIAVMSTHWEAAPGVALDTRSVLLCISGLFFGVVPTLLAVLITGVFRLYLGGAGAWAGVMIIVASGGIGLAWRYGRRRMSPRVSTGELFSLGVVVHVVMLLCMVTLPMPTALEVLSITSGPVLVIFPLGTVLLGKLMVGRQMRREAAENLMDSENRFRSAFEQSAVGMAQLKLSGRFVRVNRQLCDMTGYCQEDLMKKTILDITHPADVESSRLLALRALEDLGAFISMDKRYIRKDGAIAWGKDSASVVRDETGAPRYFAVVVEDITESKKRDAALTEALSVSHQSEREVKALFKATRAIPEAHHFKEAAAAIFQQCKETLGAGCGYVALLSEDGLYNSVLLLDDGGLPCDVDRDLPMPVRGLRGEAYERGKAVVDNDFANGLWAGFMPDRHVALENVLFSPLKFGNSVTGLIGLANKPGGFSEKDKHLASSFGEIMAVALRSLQDRDALAVSEQRMSAIVNAMPAMLVAFDENGHIIFWNAESERVTGHPAEEVIHRPEIMNQFYPEERNRQRVYQALSRPSGDSGATEFEITCKDGSKRTISWTNISGAAPISGWAAWAIGIDVTAQMKAKREKDQLEARLLQLQKIEAIGALAGGIAHDFNNILYPILGFAELMQEDLPPDSPLRMNVHEIITGAKRASDLVKQILTFSRRTNPDLMAINPRLIVKEAVKLARSTLPSTISIEQQIDPKAHLILADPTQIHHVVMHLITNAYHAMQELGGLLKVSLKNIVIVEKNAVYADLSPGPHVLLSVVDTGIGISKVILDRIFDPYFSTKPKDKGTGLGLSIVYGIVKSYHGEIVVHSALGEGTTVDVYFPAVSVVPEVPAADAISNRGENERILLVEDEEQILRLEKQMLERLGYRVTAFTSSVDALKTFSADPAAFDLVITDMTMPRMTGERLNQELSMIRRDLPVILCTGFSEYMSPEKAEAFGMKGFLMKPVVKSELAEIVRKVLDDAKRVEGNIS